MAYKITLSKDEIDTLLTALAYYLFDDDLLTYTGRYKEEAENVYEKLELILDTEIDGDSK